MCRDFLRLERLREPNQPEAWSRFVQLYTPLLYDWARGLGFANLYIPPRAVDGPNLLYHADLVISGEGSFDRQSLRGKLITAVASSAAARGVPCIVIAGQVSVGRGEAAAAGVEAAYSVAEHAGGVAASMADPAGTLAALAHDVAAQWRHR